MKQIILSLVCYSFVFISFSQEFSSEVFHSGFYVTINKDTVKCQMKYDLELNTLTTKQGKKTKSFTSQQIFYFKIYDDILDKIRTFYSIPHFIKPKYKIPVFFELIYEGKMSIISKEAISIETVNSTTPYWGGGGSTRKVVNYSYYFLDRKGRISFFSGKKKDLFMILDQKDTQIKNFIKKEHLRTDKISDLIKITQEYNSLIK